MTDLEPSGPYLLSLEFTRATAAEDPYAFASGRQPYLLREAGGVYSGFEIDWDEALLADLSALSRPDPPPALVARLGERLRQILLGADWETHDRQIGRALRGGRRVFIDILSAAAELYSLPWELVPTATGQPLAALPAVLLRYAWPATATTTTETQPSARLLFAWSDAADPVPWMAQEQALRQAVAKAAPLTPITLDVLPHATPASLAEALKARPTLLHLLCHGRGGARGGLVLHGTDRDEDIVDPSRLRQILAPTAADLRQVVLCACGSGAWASVANPLGSLTQAVHRLGVRSVIGFRIPVSQEGATRVTAAVYDGLFGALSSLEQAHLDGQAALIGLPTLDWAALQLLARAEDGLDTRPVIFRPYRGLLPFGREHQPFFFGRERVVAEVVEELDRLVRTPGLPDILFLSGPSGVGKSSLLAAGVLPALEARWPGLVVARTRPGGKPLESLESAVSGLGPGPALLVIDQLEEIFTLGATPQDRAAWASRLWAVLLSGVRCLAAIRGDYLDRLGEIPLPDGRRLDALAYDDAHRAFIPRLQPDDMMTAISRPAEVVGLALEPGLAERILADVGNEPGALPLMQHALDLLWQRREGRLLTLRAYEQDLHGVDGALSRYADGVLEALPSPQRALARRLLPELVLAQGDIALATRRRRSLDEVAAELDHPDGLERVVDALVDARLVVRDDGDAARPATLEIAHEALIRRWPTLQGWLQEGAESRAARAWLRALADERSREPRFVLQGAQLAAAVQMRDRFAGQIPADLLDFIQDSEAVAAAQARREAEARHAELARIARDARRATRTLIAASLGLLVVVGLLIFAGRQKLVAQEEAARAADAVEQAQRKTDEAAAAEGRKAEALAAQRDAEDKEAIAKASEQDAKARTMDAEHKTEEANRATAKAVALQSAAERAVRAAEAQLIDTRQALASEAERSAAQRQMRVAAATQDPTFRALILREVAHPERYPEWLSEVLDLADQPIARWTQPVPDTPISALVFSRDAAWVAAGDTSGRVRVWRTRDGAPIADLRLEQPDLILALAASPDGRQLMAWSSGNVATFWDLAQQTIARRVVDEDHFNAEHSLSPSWRYLSFAGAQDVVVVDLETGARATYDLSNGAGPQQLLDGVAFSGDGAAVVLWSTDRVAIWDLATGRRDAASGPLKAAPVGYLPTPEGPGCLLRDVPGDSVDALPLDGRSTCAPNLLERLATSRGAVWSYGTSLRQTAESETQRYSDDLRYLVTASGDGFVRLFNRSEGVGLMQDAALGPGLAAFPAATSVAVSVDDAGLRLLHLDGAEAGPRTLATLPLRCGDAVCTEDGGRCALSQCEGRWARQIFAVDARRPDAARALPNPSSWINDVALSPSGGVLGVAANDGVYLWPASETAWRHIPLPAGLEARQLSFEDEEGAVLVATARGQQGALLRISAAGAVQTPALVPTNDVITALALAPGQPCAALIVGLRVGRWCAGDKTIQLQDVGVSHSQLTDLQMLPSGDAFLASSDSEFLLVAMHDLSVIARLPSCDGSSSVLLDEAGRRALVFNTGQSCAVSLVAQDWRAPLWRASDTCLDPATRVSLGLAPAAEARATYEACRAQVAACAGSAQDCATALAP